MVRDWLILARGLLPVTVAVGLLTMGGCAVPVAIGSSIVSPAEARAVVIHHWDLNRQALRATSGAEAKRLIEQVEAGDALKMDEAIISQEAQNQVGRTVPPPIPDATNVRVFVPRQAAYPAVFLSIRTEAAGGAAGVGRQTLELFRRASPGDAWHNVGYADVAPALAAKLDIAVDSSGYAAFGPTSPTGASLSTLYTRYMSAVLNGHSDQASKRVAPGPLTDGFATDLQRAPSGVKTVVTFSASTHQEGISLRTGAGGSFVVFENLYEIAATATGGCAIFPQESFSSADDHFMQNIGAVVAPGSNVMSVLAASDSVISSDTKPCTAGGTTV